MFNSGTAWYATTRGSRRIGRCTCVQVAKTYKATQQLKWKERSIDQTLHLAATSWFCEKSCTLSALHMHGHEVHKKLYQATLASYSSLIVSDVIGYYRVVDTEGSEPESIQLGVLQIKQVNFLGENQLWHLPLIT